MHANANDALEKKKSTSSVKTDGVASFYFAARGSGFRCKRTRDTGNAWFPVKPGRNFLSLFFLSFLRFSDSRQTGKATIKNAARGNVERGIGYFAQVWECIFHITALCHET